ncbi:MAG: hypothetical protein C3F12_07355 [Candidatus Methylomirabilota bacterium]|nr:MAG: hypothetical protein C3F12_07355 [candidate division NC10 bacterium]
MDRARPVRFRLRFVFGVMSIMGLSGTGQQQPKQPAERAGIPMIMGIRGQQQKADGQHYKGRRQTFVSAPPLALPASFHLPPSEIGLHACLPPRMA